MSTSKLGMLVVFVVALSGCMSSGGPGSGPLALSGEPAPVATALADKAQADRVSPVRFTASGTNVASWSWNFGDGETSTEQNPSHTYRGLGSFQPTLTVKNTQGTASEVQLPVLVVRNIPPAASFTYSPEVFTTGDQVQFSDRSTDADGRIVRWDWHFGDNGERPSGASVIHQFTKVGSQRVMVTATDNDGASSTSTLDVQVTSASITVTNLKHQDLSCNDQVPFSFNVNNEGQVAAKNIRILVTGGYEDFTATIQSISPGSSQAVQGSIYATDACGYSDYYTLSARASPSNGQPAERSTNINI